MTERTQKIPEGCAWCDIGVPVNARGNHIIKHYYGVGDGAVPCTRTTAIITEPSEHHYISTACQHGKHQECRKLCKFCGAKCACGCEHPEPSEITDTQRLDWILKRNVQCSIYGLRRDDGVIHWYVKNYRGIVLAERHKSGREAIDDAMKKETPR